MFGTDSGPTKPSSIRWVPDQTERPRRPAGRQDQLLGHRRGPPPPATANIKRKWRSYSTLGWLTTKGGPQSVLEGTPVSRHTAADGTGQMPLAEEVTCVGKAGAGACCGHCREAETHRGAEVRAGGGDHGGRPGWRRLRRGTWPQSRRHISGFRCAGTGFWRGRGSSGDRSGRDDQPAGAAVGRGRRAAAAPHPASQT